MLALVAFTGCGEDAAPSGADGYETTVYRAQATQGGKQVGRFDGVRVRLDAATIHVELGQGTLSFFAGCNRYDATATARDGTLQVAAFTQTRLQCPAELENVDAWLAGFFAGPVRVSETPLVMTAGRRVLRLAPDPEYVLPESDEVVPQVLQHGSGAPPPEPPTMR